MPPRNDEKIVAIKKRASWIPAKREDGVVRKSTIADKELTRGEVIEHCMKQAGRADEKFNLGRQPRRAQEVAATRDSFLALAEKFADGLGQDAPVDLDAEFSEEYAQRHSPDGKSLLDVDGMLEDLLARPLQAAPA